MKKREERVRFLDKVANLQDWTADVFGEFETQSFAHRHHESIELVRIVLNAEFGDIIEDAEKWAYCSFEENFHDFIEMIFVNVHRNSPLIKPYT